MTSWPVSTSDPPKTALTDSGVRIAKVKSPIHITFTGLDPGEDSSTQIWAYKNGDWSQLTGDQQCNPSAIISGTKVVAPLEHATGDESDDHGPDTPPSDTPPSDTPPSDTPPSDTPPSDTPPRSDSPPSDTPPNSEKSDARGTGIEGTDTVLEILAASEESFEYEIVVEGSAEPTSIDDVSADSGDTIDSTGQNKVTISGSTVDNAGDAFTITGEIIDVRITGGTDEYKLVFGGDDITDQVTSDSESDDSSQGPGNSHGNGDSKNRDDTDSSLVLTVESTADNQFEYEIVVAGDVSPTSTSSVSVDPGDSVESRDDGTAVITGAIHAANTKQC